jgi:broad specificity phosphatase PhoE
MPTVLLIRHAQASFGSADYDVLSDVGHAQAAALVPAMEHRGIVPARVASGALRRQRDTAAPLSAAAGLEPLIDPRWDEYDDMDVLSHHSASAARLTRRPGDDAPPLTSRDFQSVLDDALGAWVLAGPSSGCRQPWPDFLARTSGALADLAEGLEKGETAVAVTSSGVIAALTATLLGLPPAAFVALNHVSVNTAITKLVVGRSGTTAVSYNEHGHLDGAAVPMITYR